MYEEVNDPEVADLFMSTKAEHDTMLAKCQRLFTEAESWRKAHETRWKKWYQLSQSHVEREEGQWGSIVFVPLIFTILETIKSRMTAQLPEPIVYPVGPDDGPRQEPDPMGVPDPMTGQPPMHTVDPSREMEDMLRWAARQSGLYLQLVNGIDSALRYGTGIFKVTPDKRSTIRKKRQPVMEPVMASSPVMDPETGQPLAGIDGGQVTQDVPTGEQQDSGRTEMVEEEIIHYVGPHAECLDLFSVYVDPMATSFDDAEYVIHRAFKPKSWVEAKITSKYFRKPDYIGDGEFIIPTDDPAQQRLSSVNLGGSKTEPDRIEVQEHWYRDGTVVTTLARKWVVRVVETPFDHGEYPFIRIVDHLMPHEFYGTGEVHHLEGPQDLVNALTNQRVDNVRLKLETVFYGDSRAIDDRADLMVYPGAYIRVNNPNDQPLDQVFRPLDMGDVTSSSYNEVEFWMEVIDRASAVTPYQTGGDAEGLNDTATGVALISEQGNTRFSMKLKIAELTGLQALYRQYGALIQQFVPEDFIIRILGPEGVSFKQVEPAALSGAFDYDIEPGSSSQTETVRKQSSVELFQMAQTAVDPMGAPVFNLKAFGEDTLREYGKKDVQRYMAPPPLPAPTPAIDEAAGGIVDPNAQPEQQIPGQTQLAAV